MPRFDFRFTNNNYESVLYNVFYKNEVVATVGECPEKWTHSGDNQKITLRITPFKKDGTGPKFIDEQVYIKAASTDDFSVRNYPFYWEVEVQCLSDRINDVDDEESIVGDPSSTTNVSIGSDQ